MIVADFSRNADGFRMRVKGHAGYDEAGRDIVCAAASGLVYALCGYLLNFKKGSFSVNELEKGLIEIDCGHDCEDYLQLACIGFYQLARDYPNHVCVRYGAWNWKMVT